MLALANNKAPTPTLKNIRRFRIRRSCASQPTVEAITSLLQLFFNKLKFSSKCKLNLQEYLTTTLCRLAGKHNRGVFGIGKSIRFTRSTRLKMFWLVCLEPSRRKTGFVCQLNINIEKLKPSIRRRTPSCCHLLLLPKHDTDRRAMKDQLPA